jgi:hypothetical protein
MAADSASIDTGYQLPLLVDQQVDALHWPSPARIPGSLPPRTAQMIIVRSLGRKSNHEPDIGDDDAVKPSAWREQRSWIVAGLTLLVALQSHRVRQVFDDAPLNSGAEVTPRHGPRGGADLAWCR